MSKHDLRARPVFHHTHDAIEAHLTVVMAALAVARYIQDATGISIARIVRELRSLQEVTINLNGHHLAAAPRLTDAANDILTALCTAPRPGHACVLSPAFARLRCLSPPRMFYEHRRSSPGPAEVPSDGTAD